MDHIWCWPTFGGHDGVPGNRLLNGVQNLAGGQLVPLLHHLGLPQGEDMFLPRLVVVLGQALVEQLQHPLGRPDDVVVGEHVFIDLRAVDVDVDDLGLAGEGVRLEGHPVGEPAAHGNQ